jgi:hypothetical protein
MAPYGSRRYRDLVKHLHHHELELLQPGPAKQLFRFWTGLGFDAVDTDAIQVQQLEPQAVHQLQRLEVDIVKACAGLPLALELTGARLTGVTDPRQWQYVLTVIQEGARLQDVGTDARLKDVLVSSFQGLSEAARNMFLDVVSVLHGRDSEAANDIWDVWWAGAAAGAFTELQRRALLRVDDEGRLRTHDVIRAFGRGIICDPQSQQGLRRYYGSRTWVKDGQLVRFEQGKAMDLVALSTEGTSNRQIAQELLSTGVTGALGQLRILLLQGHHGGALIVCQDSESSWDEGPNCIINHGQWWDGSSDDDDDE